MALSQQDLDRLDMAIASGELTVSFGGRLVTYQNTTQLLQARDHVARILRQQTALRVASFGGRPYALSSFNTD